jgi:hypothetical protein
MVVIHQAHDPPAATAHSERAIVVEKGPMAATHRLAINVTVVPRIPAGDEYPCSNQPTRARWLAFRYVGLWPPAHDRGSSQDQQQTYHAGDQGAL